MCFMVSFEQFNQIEFKVATVIKAEEIENTEKLLKLQLDIGEEKVQQIVSGLRPHYKPENLVGKQVIIIANLEPRVIKGVTSEGMLFAADSANGPVLILPEKKVENGARVI